MSVGGGVKSSVTLNFTMLPSGSGNLRAEFNKKLPIDLHIYINAFNFY